MVIMVLLPKDNLQTEDVIDMQTKFDKKDEKYLLIFALILFPSLIWLLNTSMSDPNGTKAILNAQSVEYETWCNYKNDMEIKQRREDVKCYKNGNN